MTQIIPWQELTCTKQQESLSEQFAQMLEDFDNAFSTDPETGKQNLIYRFTDGQEAYRKVCEIGSRNYESNDDCIRAILKGTRTEEFFLALPFLRRG